jgi:cyclopropane fatty-acyl-phospholipid synthase-like methyltransferase
MNQPTITDKHLATWEGWNSGGGPKYPHEKVVQFCFRNYPAAVRAQTHALDLGCGGGVHTLFLAAEGFQVTACDISENGVQCTRAALEARGLKADVSVCAMQDISYPPQSFDLVLCIATLGAAGMEAARGALDRLGAICKPGAKAFFLFEADDDFHGLENELNVHGFSRAEVEGLFLPRFSKVWIDEHTSTYQNGRLFQKDWLVTVFF